MRYDQMRAYLQAGKTHYLSDQETSEALKYIFQYADNIEAISKQMNEIKKNLRDSLKSQGIDEMNLLEN